MAEPWGYEQRSLQKLLSDTASTVATMADWRYSQCHGTAAQLTEKQSTNTAKCRPFLLGSEIWASHWVKFGWEGDHANGHACWGNGWGDPHSCEYSMLSRLDVARRELVPVHVFRQPVAGGKVG